MNLRLFNCPVDGECIRPPGMTAAKEEKGRFTRTGPRVCSHFRADGKILYCSYAREVYDYSEEGPTGKDGAPSPGGRRHHSGRAGLWSNAYVSARSGRGERRPAPVKPAPPSPAVPHGCDEDSVGVAVSTCE